MNLSFSKIGVILSGWIGELAVEEAQRHLGGSHDFQVNRKLLEFIGCFGCNNSIPDSFSFLAFRSKNLTCTFSAFNASIRLIFSTSYWSGFSSFLTFSLVQHSVFEYGYRTSPF